MHLYCNSDFLCPQHTILYISAYMTKFRLEIYMHLEHFDAESERCPMRADQGPCDFLCSCKCMSGAAGVEVTLWHHWLQSVWFLCWYDLIVMISVIWSYLFLNYSLPNSHWPSVTSLTLIRILGKSPAIKWFLLASCTVYKLHIKEVIV